MQYFISPIFNHLNKIINLQRNHGVLVVCNQSFKINFSHSVESENDWNYTYISKIENNAILKRKITNLGHHWQRFWVAILAAPSTKNFTLNFPFLHYSLPTAAFLPFRYTSLQVNNQNYLSYSSSDWEYSHAFNSFVPTPATDVPSSFPEYFVILSSSRVAPVLSSCYLGNPAMI